MARRLIRVCIIKTRQRYIWDSFLSFYGLETCTACPVTQQNNTSVGEIRSKKYSDFMDGIVISFSPNVTG